MYFDDFRLNALFCIPPVVMEKEKMLAFANTYDPLPIHTDEEYAACTHFGALIAPGVMSFMSIWAKFLEHNPFGNELIAGKSTKIEWLKPVYAQDLLTGQAEITALTRRSARNGVVELTFRVVNQHGESVLINVTEVVVKCRPQA